MAFIVTDTAAAADDTDELRITVPPVPERTPNEQLVLAPPQLGDIALAQLDAMCAKPGALAGGALTHRNWFIGRAFRLTAKVYSVPEETLGYFVVPYHSTKLCLRFLPGTAGGLHTCGLFAQRLFLDFDEELAEDMEVIHSIPPLLIEDYREFTGTEPPEVQVPPPHPDALTLGAIRDGQTVRMRYQVEPDDEAYRVVAITESEQRFIGAAYPFVLKGTRGSSLGVFPEPLYRDMPSPAHLLFVREPPADHVPEPRVAPRAGQRWRHRYAPLTVSVIRSDGATTHLAFPNTTDPSALWAVPRFMLLDNYTLLPPDAPEPPSITVGSWITTDDTTTPARVTGIQFRTPNPLPVLTIASFIADLPVVDGDRQYVPSNVHPCFFAGAPADTKRELPQKYKDMGMTIQTISGKPYVVLPMTYAPQFIRKNDGILYEIPPDIAALLRTPVLCAMRVGIASVSLLQGLDGKPFRHYHSQGAIATWETYCHGNLQAPCMSPEDAIRFRDRCERMLEIIGYENTPLIHCKGINIKTVSGASVLPAPPRGFNSTAGAMPAGTYVLDGRTMYRDKAVRIKLIRNLELPTAIAAERAALEYLTKLNDEVEEYDRQEAAKGDK